MQFIPKIINLNDKIKNHPNYNKLSTYDHFIISFNYNSMWEPTANLPNIEIILHKYYIKLINMKFDFGYVFDYLPPFTFTPSYDN